VLNLKLKNNYIQISCDGGAATGKSTGAKLIAKKFKLKFLSSGLLYRYASFLLLNNKPKNKIDFIKSKFKNLNYKNLNNKKLHSPEISKFSTEIAKISAIRKILKKYQINFSLKYKNCCIEGRDISTKILPKSDLKFFFICNINIAAKRRYKELRKRNRKIKFQDVKKALRIRNISDINRKNSPLLKHRDSIEIDTGKLDKQAMIAKMSKYVKKVINNKKYGNRTRVKK
tara:strand:- start:54 stop:740 length:687 start_codon:yes stop_codon:yes gene_type:complete